MCVCILKRVVYWNFDIQEKINVLFDLESVLKGEVPITAAMREGFMEFAEKLAPIGSISDGGSANIVWDGKRWILLDWDGSSRIVSTLQDSNPIIAIRFEGMYTRPFEFHPLLVLA